LSHLVKQNKFIELMGRWDHSATNICNTSGHVTPTY